MSKNYLDLSIIIVSYNSWEFLDLTLFSMQQAIKDLEAEVIVVDNASAVSIAEKVAHYYPFVKVIANNQNLGFAKANNRGLQMAKGKVAVLVNPDVIVAEDTFCNVLNYYQSNDKAGALGVRMINGEGRFLKESKRGIPTPFTSFCKIMGLTALFPSSKLLARYYHGNLDEKNDHDVEILSGAFLAQQRDEKGQFQYLEEQYFMYGEDIDLSYSILQKGNNRYLGSSPIIHFKGKSTVTDKNIYRYFYQSMWIFYRKYFYKRRLFLLNGLIWLAINGIQRLKIALLSFKQKSEPFREAPKYRNIAFIGTDATLVDKLQIRYTSEIKRVERWDEAIGFDLIILDLKTMALKDLITIVDKCGQVPYVYVAPSRKYIIQNNLVNGKGQVVLL
nr:glycosyltransferase family 2 protein [uncultured Carboxylicivirga sp.]